MFFPKKVFIVVLSLATIFLLNHHGELLLIIHSALNYLTIRHINYIRDYNLDFYIIFNVYFSLHREDFSVYEKCSSF
jgi:hypothetical protein